MVKNKNLTERMTARVVGSNGYVDGNAAALQNVIGLTESNRRSTPGSGCRSRPRTRASSELVGGLLSSQVSKEIEIGGPYTYGTGATVGGQHALAILGSVSTTERLQGAGRALRPEQRQAPADRGDHQRREVGRFVGHPRHRGVLAMGREQEPDGADPHGVAAEARPRLLARRPPPGRSARWRHCSEPCRATSRQSGWTRWSTRPTEARRRRWRRRRHPPRRRGGTPAGGVPGPRRVPGRDSPSSRTGSTCRRASSSTPWARCGSGGGAGEPETLRRVLPDARWPRADEVGALRSLSRPSPPVCTATPRGGRRGGRLHRPQRRTPM